jgi:hypothetical protein
LQEDLVAVHQAAVEDPEEVALVDEEVSDFVQIECVSG